MHNAIMVRHARAYIMRGHPLGGYPSGDAICIDKERQCDYDFNSANYFAYILATVCDIV